MISYNDRTSEDLFNQILKPVFKFSKSIKIIDRLIAGHISKDPYELSGNYKNNLDYIAECISKSNCKASVEIFTTIYLFKSVKAMNDQEKDNIIKTLDNIDNFIDTINEKYGLDIKCVYGCGKGKLPHDRFLITDQIGLAIGRGFDLLDDEKKVRDNTISIIDNKGSIETQIRSLGNIRFLLAKNVAI